MEGRWNEARMADLERRVQAMEGLVRNLLWGAQPEAAENPLMKTMLGQWGEVVNKNQAAHILGVTRATVYVMLNDGRLDAAFGGKKVSVRSIVRYMQARTPEYSRAQKK